MSSKFFITIKYRKCYENRWHTYYEKYLRRSPLVRVYKRYCTVCNITSSWLLYQSKTLKLRKNKMHRSR